MLLTVNTPSSRHHRGRADRGLVTTPHPPRRESLSRQHFAVARRREAEMPATEEPFGTADLIELESCYGAHNYAPLDVVVSHAQGVWVYDVEGRRYLDCLAAYSALNHGHCHPRILSALIEQAHKVTLTSRAFHNDQLPLLARELHDLT